MKDNQIRKLFRTKQVISIFQIENGDQSQIDKILNAASWEKKLCEGRLQLYENQYGQLKLCIRSKKGQTIIENQYLMEDINKKILVCKDTCRGYKLEAISPDGSMNMKIGILFETRIEAFEFQTTLNHLLNK